MSFTVSTPAGKLLGTARNRSRSVPNSPELERVIALPRRQWRRGLGGDYGDAEHVRSLLSRALRQKDSTAELRLVQSAVIADAHDFGGALGAIRVGGGKTLISLLLPVALQSKRPVLLVPASLRDKTKSERDEYARDWRVPPITTDPNHWPDGHLLVMSYAALSKPNKSSTEALDAPLGDLKPDLLVMDEAHTIAKRGSRRRKRVERYISNARKSGAPLVVVAMTGTLAKKSLRDYAHLLDWTLGSGSPVPRSWVRMVEWADALDRGVNGRLSVGALARLCSSDEQAALSENPLKACRRAFASRFVTTPGVVSMASMDIVADLEIRAMHAEPSPAIAEALQCLRNEWITPAGEPLADAPQRSAAIRQVASGIYHYWPVPPPVEWLEARREWCGFVRDTIRTNRSGWDTEGQVRAACKSGAIDSKEYLEWERLRDIFDPSIRKATWLCESVAEIAADWIQQYGGLVWTEHVEFGRRLGQLASVPYFRQRGRAAGVYKGLAIENHVGPAVLSIASNSVGRNLQAWNRNLVISPPSSGARWEQLLGRSHRDGQKAEVVSCEVLVTCREHIKSFQEAVADARYLEETTGQPQKLLYADVVDVSPPLNKPKGW